MRVRAPNKGPWLFPVMVVAAALTVAFGFVGLAAVTGHLPASVAAHGPDGAGQIADSAASTVALGARNP